MSEWRLGPKASKPELIDARLQAHWAAQLVGAVGASVLPERDDYTHTSMTRPAGSALLVGEPLDAHAGDRVGLSVRDLRLVRLGPALEETSALSLDGRTLEEGRQWLCDSFGADIALIGYELPPHPVGEGSRFTLVHPEAFHALSQGFVNASDVLGSGASDVVRCWPHHFDIAYLVSIEGGRSIGVGWTPGDGSYDEPYWYVTPWPYPKLDRSPDLPAGHWHVEGFVAAILTASEIGPADDARAERRAVSDFLDEAIAASRSLLEMEQRSDD